MTGMIRSAVAGRAGPAAICGCQSSSPRRMVIDMAHRRASSMTTPSASRIVAANGSADFLAACRFAGLSAPDAAALFRHARPRRHPPRTGELPVERALAGGEVIEEPLVVTSSDGRAVDLPTSWSRFHRSGRVTPSSARSCSGRTPPSGGGARRDCGRSWTTTRPRPVPGRRGPVCLPQRDLPAPVRPRGGVRGPPRRERARRTTEELTADARGFQRSEG